jgi:hypothetical protein
MAAGASNFKQLPPGWKVRIKTLDEDLIERPESGVATIMPDEFFNMYDKTGGDDELKAVIHDGLGLW